MAIPKIPQGSDLTVNVTVSDSSGAIDLDTLSGIACWIVSDKGKVIQKFSQNAITGFDTLTITDAPNGIFQIQITATNTRVAKAGIYSAEVKQQIPDGYNQFTSVSTKKAFMEITEAVSVATSDLT